MLIESSRAYGRGCLLGVAAYIRAHGPWHVHHVERGLTEALPSHLRRWKGDGVLARIENRRFAEAIAKLELPTVDLRGSYCPDHGCTFDTDHHAVARMAAEHFLEIGFRDFAFCGFPGVDFSDRREDAFRQYLSMRGYGAAVFTPRGGYASETDILAREARGELETDRIGEWLLSLRRPLAVFACNDVRGRQVLEACARNDVTVPEEVAVVGVDDDEVVCELADPPLSSIEPDTRRIGYEGAAMLDRLMQGEEVAEKRVFIPPRGIRRRLSSEATAIDDREVAAAMQLIRDRSCEGITVQHVVKALNVSRSTLERRFQRIFNRSPASEIERIRMARAKLLLADTNYKLAKIAALTGYNSAAQFATAFKRHTKVTPGKFRAESHAARILGD
jgi:LacI family transcriptional regulator